ncbi:hypothetical protein [Nonomuraea wenchangensis]|uniref:Helix-turn-helix domain-containing protein n=1 Tax=Nonomuraea wenchangensis TaxID=568860 RepID=A0A1I0LU49_9ACTN|nr:hypothetical protein [Nonomuraea wenchangensis]SEU46749.1 hypothetical protein SAMN05421811_127136 [Nonomuraea wenchangensis]
MSDLPDLMAGPSRAVIAAAVPRGMRRAGSQQEWLRTLKEDLEVLELRADGYSNLLRVANLIVWAADWSTLCSRPTIARIVDVTGLARPTVKRWIRWLRDRGWLGVVEQGSTCRFRKGTGAGLLDDGLGNRAALWVLAVPRRTARDHRQEPAVDQPEQISEPPSVSLRRRETSSPTRTREERSPRRRSSRISPTWSLHDTARTKRDKIALCERLRAEDPLLRRVTAWYLRWWLAPFIDEGWTAADVLHALNVRPDDSRWTYTWSSASEIRHVPGWVRHRLAAWLDSEGRPVPSRSQRRAAADAARRAEQAARRAERARMAAAAGWLEVPGPRPAAEDDGHPVEAVASTPAAGPNAAWRKARAETERRRREKEAAELAALAAWEARRRAERRSV